MVRGTLKTVMLSYDRYRWLEKKVHRRTLLEAFSMPGLEKMMTGETRFPGMEFSSTTRNGGVIIGLKRCSEPQAMSVAAQAALKAARKETAGKTGVGRNDGKWFEYGIGFCRNLCVVAAEERTTDD